MSEEILSDSNPKSALTEIFGNFALSFKEPLITLPFHRTSL